MHENTGIPARCIGCKSAKLLNRFQFHQLQLKSNKTAWMKRRTYHCVVHCLIMPPLVGEGEGEWGGVHASSPANDLQ